MAVLLVLVPLCVGSLVFLRRERISEWARVRLEEHLSRILGGQVRIGRLEVHPLGLEGDLRDLDVSLPFQGSPRLTASLTSGRVRLAWQGLLSLGAGRIHLRELVLSHPIVFVDRSFLDARVRAAEGQGRPFDMRIDRLEVTDGTVFYEDRTVPFSIQSEDVHVRGEWDRVRRSLAGEARFSGVLTEPLFRRPVPVVIETGFRLGTARLDLVSLAAEAPGLKIDLDGHVTFGEDARFVGEGRAAADLDTLGPWLSEEIPHCGGRVSGALRIEKGATPVHVTGHLAATGAKLGPLSAAAVEAEVSYRPGELRLTGLVAKAYGGTVRGTVTVVLARHHPFQAEIEGAGLDVESLLALAGRKLPFASRAGLVLKLDGEPGRLETWNGSGRVDAVREPAGPGRLAASAAAEFTIVAGLLHVHSPQARTDAGTFDARMDLDLRTRPPSGNLLLVGTTSSARSTQTDVETLLASMGISVPDPLREPLGGSGPFRARIGLGGPADLDLFLRLENGSWGDDAFQEGELDLSLRGEHVDLRKLSVETAEGTAQASGRMRLRPFAFELLRASARDFSATPLLRRFAPGLPLEGALSGEIEIVLDAEGQRNGSGNVVLARGQLAGEPFDRAEATVALRGSEVTLSGLVLRGPAGEARGEIRMDFGGSSVEVAVLHADLSLGGLNALRSRGLDVSGRVVLEGLVRRDSAGFSGELRLDGTGWAFRGAELGEVKGKLGVKTQGLDVDLGPGSDSSWHVAGRVEWSEDLPVAGVLEMDQALVPLPVGSASNTAWALVSGRAEIRGTLRKPEGLEATGEIRHAEIHLGPVTAQTLSAIPLRLESQVLTAGPAHFEGRNSDVEAMLRYRLADHGIEAKCSGRLDVGSIAALWPDLRATGQASLDLNVTGTIEDTDWRGSLEVRDGRLRTSALPDTLEKIDLVLILEKRVARLQEFSALLGGGEVRATGQLELEGLRPGAYAVSLLVADVRIAYPEGFKGVYEGSLALEGSGDAATLKGRLQLVRGAYTREFAEYVGKRPVSMLGGTPGLPTLLLNLDIKADGNVWVQNDVARIEAAVDLHLGGDLQRPEVTGRIWALEGGSVRLRDIEYRVVSGSLDFVDLERINPYLDLKAETRVREYDISLSVEGTADKLRYELTSNPSLSTQDIIALLTTGNTPQETSSASQGGTTYTSDMAAEYVVGALTGGLERKLKSALGLERVRIDPVLLQEQADPTARITVGKRVSKDVLLVYSADLGSTEQQIYRAEWEASRRLRLSAERNTTGGVGGELGYFTRLGAPRKTAPAAPSASPGASRPDVAPEGQVAEVRIEGVSEHDRAELAKQLPLRAGAPYRRSDVFAGEEAMRSYYVNVLRIEARVDSEIGPEGGEGRPVRVVYHVVPGPHVEVRIEGLERKDLRRLETRLAAFWKEAVFIEDLYRDAEDLIRRDLRDRGLYAAEVRTEMTGEGDERLVRFLVEPGVPVKVDSVRIEGASAIPEAEIRRVITMRPSSPIATRLVRPEVLERDREAIARLYQDRGFLRARIEPPRVRLSVDGSSAEITFHIDEGPRYVIAGVEAEGGGPFSSAQLLGWAELQVGEFFSYGRLLAAESAIRARLDEQGYPEARVISRYDLTDREVKIRFDVTPGGRKIVGEIGIVGNDRTREKVIRRELLLAPGDVLSRDRMIASQQRLYRLGLFRSVRLEYAPMVGADSERQILRVRVEEASPLLLSLSAGYDTEAGPRGSFSITHVNVGGYDRSLALQGTVSKIYKRLQVVTREPRLFNWPLPALLSLGWEIREQTGFTEDKRSSALRVEKKFRPGLSGFVRYNYQRVNLSNVENQLAVQEEKLENVKLGDMGYTIVRDGRDDAFMTTQGGYATLEARVFAPAFLSESSFVKTFLQGSRTHTWANRNTLATALRFGAEVPYGNTERVPLPERFFAGGDSSLRGFPRDGVGPKTADGTPEGGQALLLFNEEWRFPIWRNLKGELFYDAGNVWTTLGDVAVGDLRHVLGVGARLETPIGPIRLEYGRKLQRNPGESRGEVFFSIGAAF